MRCLSPAELAVLLQQLQQARTHLQTRVLSLSQWLARHLVGCAVHLHFPCLQQTCQLHWLHCLLAALPDLDGALLHSALQRDLAQRACLRWHQQWWTLPSQLEQGAAAAPSSVSFVVCHCSEAAICLAVFELS